MRNFKGILQSEEGSIIVVALLVLAIMTVIGISASDTVITENYIVRNVALRKQNVNLGESAIMEGYQKVMQQEYPEDTRHELEESNAGDDGDVSLWLNSNDKWENDGLDKDWYGSEATGRVLEKVNSVEPDLTDDSSVLKTRGEVELKEPKLRMALVGWEASSIKGETSLKATEAVRRSGRILAEYISEKNGMVRIEIGVERIF